MHPTIRNLGLIVTLSLVFACKKNTNDPAPGNKLPELSKVIVWTSASPVPTIEIYEYHFDSLNRVTEVDYSKGDSILGESQATLMNPEKWFYKGNEQQPYKCTGRVIGDYEKYFFYDNQGKLISDSLVTSGCNCYYLEKYSQFNDKIMINSTSASYSAGATSTYKDSSVIDNTNYLANYNFNSYPNELRGRIYTYDNKLNPVHTLNIRVAYLILSPAWGFATGYSGNNATEVTSGSIPLSGPNYGTFIKQTTYTYKYNYNTDNLPTDCAVTNNSVYPYPVKMKFYYSN